MSDSLPTRARALADNRDYNMPNGADRMIRDLADLCDTYREALERLARDVDPSVHRIARVALASGDQAPDPSEDQ